MHMAFFPTLVFDVIKFNIVLLFLLLLIYFCIFCVCVYCKTLKFHSTPLLYKLWTTVAVDTIIFDTNLIGDQFENPV